MTPPDILAQLQDPEDIRGPTFERWESSLGCDPTGMFRFDAIRFAALQTRLDQNGRDLQFLPVPDLPPGPAWMRSGALHPARRHNRHGGLSMPTLRSRESFAGPHPTPAPLQSPVRFARPLPS